MNHLPLLCKLNIAQTDTMTYIFSSVSKHWQSYCLQSDAMSSNLFLFLQEEFFLLNLSGGQNIIFMLLWVRKKLSLILVFQCLQRFFRSDIFSEVWSKELTSVSKNYPDEVHPLPNPAVFSIAWPCEFEVNTSQN